MPTHLREAVLMPSDRRPPRASPFLSSTKQEGIISHQRALTKCPLLADPSRGSGGSGSGGRGGRASQGREAAQVLKPSHPDSAGLPWQMQPQLPQALLLGEQGEGAPGQQPQLPDLHPTGTTHLPVSSVPRPGDKADVRQREEGRGTPPRTVPSGWQGSGADQALATMTSFRGSPLQFHVGSQSSPTSAQQAWNKAGKPPAASATPPASPEKDRVTPW
ncbi:uncharacterized protein LOC141512445 [Macrotis lagotis]|uniref:uncharacterized protein LOC141512445 n=1 Tax=Macrotis lagotis TaxID=92651 RepID=UPI003D68C938